MSRHLIFLTMPALRHQDLQRMPNLNAIFEGQPVRRLSHSFPAVTWPSQANMLTGALPSQHGVTANGFYWREKHEVEMWTAWNEVIQRPQLWDSIRELNPTLTSAAWFPMLSKGSSADYVCMPAPIHRPDGSEDLWCYTKPQEFYGDLLDEFEHFPLQHFWGPLANLKSSEWIANTAVAAAKKFKPNFFYIYLPHLDYGAQKEGPDSPLALKAVEDLDGLLGTFANDMENAYPDHSVDWMVASEYTITAVDFPTYPNRLLRDAGLLKVNDDGSGEVIDFENSDAWALVDHQFSQIFVRNADESNIQKVVELFDGVEGIDRVLANDQRKEIGMDHDRAGEVILLSSPNSWQAYYWWIEDQNAPDFARTVDIHRKPGYDPVELHFDMATKSVPLDATLIKGSHGLPSIRDEDKGILMSTAPLPTANELKDTDIYEIVLSHFRD